MHYQSENLQRYSNFRSKNNLAEVFAFFYHGSYELFQKPIELMSAEEKKAVIEIQVSICENNQKKYIQKSGVQMALMGQFHFIGSFLIIFLDVYSEIMEV